MPKSQRSMPNSQRSMPKSQRSAHASPRGASCLDGCNTGMALAVLAEIGRLLTALADSGATGAIDLRSLPLTAADREQLEALLGRGEVCANSTWPGARGGERAPRRLVDPPLADGGSRPKIAVCLAPEILAAHPADIRAGALRPFATSNSRFVREARQAD
jgi:hypothetical protein